MLVKEDLEHLATKKDLEEVKQDVGELKLRVGSIDRKLTYDEYKSVIRLPRESASWRRSRVILNS